MIPCHYTLIKNQKRLRIIQQLRDEAHRFGITHHRKRLEKGTVKSVLTEIDGIGYNYAQKLLWKFKSVKNIEKATLKNCKSTIGECKGENLYLIILKKKKQIQLINCFLFIFTIKFITMKSRQLIFIIIFFVSILRFVCPGF